jgi:hypothetical protein
MKNDESDEQCANARSSIDETWEPASNVTAKRHQYEAKQEERSVSIVDGRQTARVAADPACSPQRTPSTG